MITVYRIVDIVMCVGGQLSVCGIISLIIISEFILTTNMVMQQHTMQQVMNYRYKDQAHSQQNKGEMQT